jgi:hypothetical protein
MIEPMTGALVAPRHFRSTYVVDAVAGGRAVTANGTAPPGTADGTIYVFVYTMLENVFAFMCVACQYMNLNRLEELV